MSSPSVPHIEVKVTAYAEEVQRVGEENPLVFHLIFVGMCIWYFYLAFVVICWHILVTIWSHLENTSCEPCVVLIVLPAKEVSHPKVVNDVGGGSGGILGGGRGRVSLLEVFIGHMCNYISGNLGLSGISA